MIFALGTTGTVCPGKGGGATSSGVITCEKIRAPSQFLLGYPYQNELCASLTVGLVDVKVPSADCIVNFPGTDVSMFGVMPGTGPVMLEWENGNGDLKSWGMGMQTRKSGPVMLEWDLESWEMGMQT